MNGQAVRVKRYYEANTRWMLSRGSGRGEGAIHRQLWLPGIGSRRQAVHAVDALIRDTVTQHHRLTAGSDPLKLLDLGCGAGGTSVWLAGQLPAEVTGVTLSPTQARRARAMARDRGVDRRCRFAEGDFLDAGTWSSLVDDGDGSRFDAAYAVEAFSHAEDPGLFFARAAAGLAPGGLLILCDDFPGIPDEGTDALPEPRGRRNGKQRRHWMEAFRQGWHLGPLPGEERTLSAATAAGLSLLERKDLSPYLRSRYGPARAAFGLLGLLPGESPWTSSRRGGAALQVCLARGWIRYLYLVFRKG